MKTFRNIAFALALAFLFISEHTLAQFEISAEIRPRGNIDNGAGVPLADTSNSRYYLSQRTRLTFDYQKSIFQLRLTAQDVRIWGSGDIYSATGVFGSTSGLDFYEAWLKIRLHENTSIKIGRQEMFYDNQRLVSKRNWNQYGVSYDAVLLQHRQGKWNFDLALSYNTFMNYQTGRPDFADQLFFNTNLMKTFNFLRVNTSFDEHITLSLYAVAAGFVSDDAPGIIFLTGTYGFYTRFSYDHFELPVDAYYQNGKGQSGKNVSAFMFGLNPTIKFGNFKIGFGADYLSGDNAKNSDFQEQERTFNKFYGAGFGYHGWMNHYVYIKGSTQNGGLIDLYPNLSWMFNPRHKLEVRAHLFSLANPVLVGSQVVDNLNLGTEFDSRYTFTLNKEFSVNVGFSYYLSTETFELVKLGSGVNIKQPYWIWTMLTFTPTIFKR